MVQYYTSSQWKSQKQESVVDTVLIIGSKDQFVQAVNTPSSFFYQLLATVTTATSSSMNVDEPPAAKKLKLTEGEDLSGSIFKTLVSQLKPGLDSSATCEHWLTSHTSAIRLVLACFPTYLASRHNTSSKPHAISALVKKARAQARNALCVGLLLDDPAHAFAAGCAVARGQSLYSRKNVTTSPVEISVVFEDTAHGEWIAHTAEGIQLAARLVDSPTNELHTDAFIQEAKDVAVAVNAKIQIIQGKELEAQGFGGLYGVGKAAVHQPALVVLSHNSESQAKGGVVLVGKGIVYDTGGLSIKGSTTMPGMKRDMGGAAALLGAFQAAVKSKLYQGPLHVILCLAENAVGSEATRPDDVHTLYSGKTVEINNTDAEGRLVLGDGVAWAVQTLNPEILIDMATLTGAQGVATGRYFGALYCNHDELETQAIAAGKESGDLVHPLPYAPEFFRGEFKSAIADMKNSVKDRSNASCCCAGQFIGNHLGDFQTTGKWLHIDMASPAYTSSDERATGYGVALISNLLKQLNDQP